MAMLIVIPQYLRNGGKEQADFHSARLRRGIIGARSELRLQQVTDLCGEFSDETSNI